MLNWSLIHACMCMVLHFEVVLHEIPHACSYFELSPWIHLVFETIELIWASNWSFEFDWTHACYIWSMFLKFGLKLGLIDPPLGLDFTNWALNHVILCIYKCFSGNGPKGIEFDTFELDFEREVRIWEFQILNSRSSGVTGARAWKSCSQHFCSVLKSARAE